MMSTSTNVNIPLGNCPHCGREARAHCPTCGSLRCYALASRQDSVTRSDGTTHILKVWRCTKCASIFNDDDWMFRCQAAPPRRAQRQPRATRANAPELTVESLQASPEVQAVMDKWRRKLQNE